MEFLEELEELDDITMYTTNEVYTEMVGNIHWFYSYADICDEWFNTGIPEDDICYRDVNDMKQMEIDKREYYDYKKKVWFFA